MQYSANKDGMIVGREGFLAFKRLLVQYQYSDDTGTDRRHDEFTTTSVTTSVFATGTVNDLPVMPEDGVVYEKPRHPAVRYREPDKHNTRRKR